MALIFDGRVVETPGYDSVDFRDPKYHLRKGYRPRETSWIRGICLHTRMGKVSNRVRETGVDRRWDEVLAERWGRGDRMAGAHIAIDADGSYGCLVDIVKYAAFHASQLNDTSVGIEIYQGADGTLYKPALETAVYLVDVLTRELGIQRQFPLETKIARRLARGGRRPWRKSHRLSWMDEGEGGENFCGVYGHRNGTRNRGLGDPGNQIFAMLAAAGYEVFPIDADADREAWRKRQRELGLRADGIPGPKTRRALELAGYQHGLWIPRPSDAESAHVGC